MDADAPTHTGWTPLVVDANAVVPPERTDWTYYRAVDRGPVELRITVWPDRRIEVRTDTKGLEER